MSHHKDGDGSSSGKVTQVAHEKLLTSNYLVTSVDISKCVCGLKSNRPLILNFVKIWCFLWKSTSRCVWCHMWECTVFMWNKFYIMILFFSTSIFKTKLVISAGVMSVSKASYSLWRDYKCLVHVLQPNCLHLKSICVKFTWITVNVVYLSLDFWVQRI